MISFLDLLFPKICLGCGAWGRYICHSCGQKIKPLRYLKCPVCEKPAIDGMTHPGCKTKYSLDGLTSFFRYDGIVKEAIKRIKYGYAYDIAGELVDSIPSTSVLILTKLLISKHLSFSLVPIPLHTSRFRARGFNQADIVGRAFSHRLSLPLNTHIIIRAINTMPQVQMKDREKRLSNMKNVFAMKNPAIKQCNNRAIVLVDDVFTTGATLRSAASVLKHSGVPLVWGITLAQ